jgi:selenide,water dikinase
MNLVGFPCSLDMGILREILAGGQSKIEESGAKLCGGHSVQDEEPKYGLSVTGFVEEDRGVRNAGARAGDALVLTKPLGLGILTTALKREILSEEEIEDAVAVAATLNRAARDAMQEVGVSAATDVTGYGLLGHLTEMLEASSVGAVVRRGEVPVWERAVPLANDGVYPGGLKSNREYLEGRVAADGMSEEDLLPLYGPADERGTSRSRAGGPGRRPRPHAGGARRGGRGGREWSSGRGYWSPGSHHPFGYRQSAKRSGNVTLAERGLFNGARDKASHALHHSPQEVLGRDR